MQLRHVNKGPTARGNLLLPKFTNVEFTVTNPGQSFIAVPRYARECGRGTVFATESSHHAGQATIRTHAEGVHLRKIHRQQSHLRPIRQSSLFLSVLHKSLQIKIAVGVAVHNQEATTVTFIINALERPRRPENIGQFHPDLFKTELFTRRDHLFCQVMGIGVYANISDGTGLTGLQVQNRGINHGHERLWHIVCKRAQSRSEPCRQNQNIQGIVIHRNFFHYMYKDRKSLSKKN